MHSRKIYRYKLYKHEVLEVEMPAGSTVVHAEAMDRFSFCMWAVVDHSSEKTETRRFKLVHTGDEFQIPVIYHKTIVDRDTWGGNTLVYHLLELKL
jgi:hypothetical protein